MIDREPGRLDDHQRELLQCLANVAVRALELRKAARMQQKSAARLQVSEERLRRLYEMTPAMLHSLDADGRILAVSDWWLVKSGYLRDEVLGQSIMNFLAPEYRDYSRTVTRPKLLATGRFDNLSCATTTKTGDRIDVEVSAVLERDSDGNALGNVTMIEDVTLRKQAENELRQKSHRLSTIIDATEIGAWQYNVATGTIQVNEHWARQSGYALDDLSPMTYERWADFCHPDDRDCAVELVERHFAGEIDAFEYEVRKRHRDGSWFGSQVADAL